MENLLETELFGHVQGAFTGTAYEKKGWLYSANGGTVFLDEVDEMSPALQVKMLRVLQTGEYAMVGSRTYNKCDMRVIAATNKDLKTLIAENKFREDLYYRLNVIDINLPSLKDRKSDIQLLLNYYISVFEK